MRKNFTVFYGAQITRIWGTNHTYPLRCCLTAHGDLPNSLLRPTAATKATVAPDSTPSATTPSCHMLLVAHLHLTKLDLIELRRPWRLSVSGGDLQWIKPQKRFALAQLQR